MVAVGCGCDVPTVIAPRTGVTPYVGAATAVRTGGVSLVALYGPMVGGILYNPLTAKEQGIAPLTQTEFVTVQQLLGPINTNAINTLPPIDGLAEFTAVVDEVAYGPAESLYFSLVGPARIQVIPTVTVGDFDDEFSLADFDVGFETVLVLRDAATFELRPGETFVVPPGFPQDVWVTAASSGHRFSAVAIQPVTAYPPVPYTGAFPPSGPTTKTTTIPSYLYQEYQDDDDLQALVDAHNQVTQAFVDSLNALNLPDYTQQSGALLDWIGRGLYGLERPTLFSGRSNDYGPLNTTPINTLPPLDGLLHTTTYTDVAVTSDDVYKRILTWHIFKGDGRQTATEWLKRRVLRFLFGTSGTDWEGADPRVSVITSPIEQLTVTIVSGVATLNGGPLNTVPLNTTPFNAADFSVVTNPVPALSAILVEAINSGALEMPEQFAVTARIGIVGGPYTIGLVPVSAPRITYVLSAGPGYAFDAGGGYFLT